MRFIFSYFGKNKTWNSKKSIFLSFEAKNRKNGHAVQSKYMLGYLQSKKNNEKVRNKKLVRQKNEVHFCKIRTFFQNFFDFLTSKYWFWRDVPNIKVVQNKISYISLISDFSYDQNWRKSIFDILAEETTIVIYLKSCVPNFYSLGLFFRVFRTSFKLTFRCSEPTVWTITKFSRAL